MAAGAGRIREGGRGGGGKGRPAANAKVQSIHSGASRRERGKKSRISLDLNVGRPGETKRKRGRGGKEVNSSSSFFPRAKVEEKEKEDTFFFLPSPEGRGEAVDLPFLKAVTPVGGGGGGRRKSLSLPPFFHPRSLCRSFGR